jgi:hypothetical protein
VVKQFPILLLKAERANILMNLCFECGADLNKDQIALNKKMLNRSLKRFMCLSCLAGFLDCHDDDLIVKMEEFKEQGCALFG